MEHRRHLLHREWRVVDRPLVEAVAHRVALGESQGDELIGLAGGATAEARVVPLGVGGFGPARRACRSRVFDHDAHPVLAVIVREVSQDPDPRTIHLDHR